MQQRLRGAQYVRDYIPSLTAPGLTLHRRHQVEEADFAFVLPGLNLGLDLGFEATNVTEPLVTSDNAQLESSATFSVKSDIERAVGITTEPLEASTIQPHVEQAPQKRLSDVTFGLTGSAARSSERNSPRLERHLPSAVPPESTFVEDALNRGQDKIITEGRPMATEKQSPTSRTALKTSSRPGSIHASSESELLPNALIRHAQATNDLEGSLNTVTLLPGHVPTSPDSHALPRSVSGSIDPGIDPISSPIAQSTEQGVAQSARGVSRSSVTNKQATGTLESDNKTRRRLLTQTTNDDLLADSTGVTTQTPSVDAEVQGQLLASEDVLTAPDEIDQDPEDLETTRATREVDNYSPDRPAPLKSRKRRRPNPSIPTVQSAPADARDDQ